MAKVPVTFDRSIQLLSPMDIQHSLRISPRSFTRLCKSGVLPAPVLIGGCRRWRLQDIERLLAGEAQPTLAEDGDLVNGQTQPILANRGQVDALVGAR